MKATMVRFKALSFMLLLLTCVVPAQSMHELDRIDEFFDALDEEAVVPPIEAAVMTTLATIPQALFYLTLKEAVTFALTSGALIAATGAVGYTLPAVLFAFWLGVDRSDDVDKRSVIEWRRPLYVYFAMFSACVMLSLNQKVLGNGI